MTLAVAAHTRMRLCIWCIGLACLLLPPVNRAIAKTGIASLDAAAVALATLPTDAARQDMALHVSGEGHWTIVNRAGEPFTAATSDELKRGIDVLVPNDAASPTKSLHLYLTPESVFERPDKLAVLSQLPRSTSLFLTGTPTVRLQQLGSGQAIKWLAEVRPNIFMSLSERGAFSEAQNLLNRRLDRVGMRQLTLEPGGPQTLSAKPRIDRASGRVSADAIDPVHLPNAFTALAGQTAVVVGRLDGARVVFKSASGIEGAIDWATLATAAASADVNLLLVRANSGQQPGARNWLWQRVEVKGLDNALTHASLGDVFAALATPSNRLVLDATQAPSGRLRLDLHRASGLPSGALSANQVTGALSDLVAGLAGKVVHDGAILEARDSARQAELDRRLFAFLPSAMTWGLAALAALSVIGWPVARQWWRRLWPLEKASDYHNAFGYWAASSVRMVVFACVFLPLAATIAGPVAVLRLIAGRKDKSE